MTAASPGGASKAHTVEKFNAQPGDETPLACPNPACGETDHLVLIERVVTHHPAQFFDVGVTYPEIDRADEDPEIQPGDPELLGLRCGKCRWSYQGPNPLARLIKVQ